MSTPVNPNVPQQPGRRSRGQEMPAQPMPTGQPMQPGQSMPTGMAPGQSFGDTLAENSKLQSAAPSTARLPKSLDKNGIKAVPFGRLVSVELRKLVNTRGGRWLLIAMVAFILLASGGVMLTGRDAPVRFENFAMAAGIPMGFILPILGIMAVTTEWSQRSGLVTFTLEPRRVRVGLAKWLAALIMGVIATILAYAIGALFTAIGSLFHTGGAVWEIKGLVVAGTLLAFLIGVSQGVAFGMLIQNTPGAICAYLFIPILVSIITSFSWFKDIGPWVDPNQSTAHLYGASMTSTDWKHFAVAQLIWLVLPLILGFIRLNKREVKSA